jgi:tRNA/rRNA methyltransferase
MEYYFILVEPAVPGNIGAAARAIKTMGFSQLRLVKPCDHLTDEAKKMAYGAGDILQNAIIYESFTDALANIDFVTGTSAKKRTVHEDYHKCSDLPGIISAKGNTIHCAGIVFGREESGLTNDELKRCDLITHIPMISDYPSINLAQSVMIYAYVLSSLVMKDNNKYKEVKNEEGFKELKRRIAIIFADLGIDKNPTLHDRIMERISLLNEDDIHLLHSFSNKYREKYGN